MKKFSKTLRDNWIFLLMVLPGALLVDSILLHSSILGMWSPFKDYHMTSNGFIDSIVNSKWVGLDNFRFLFSSKMPLSSLEIPFSTILALSLSV